MNVKNVCHKDTKTLSNTKDFLVNLRVPIVIGMHSWLFLVFIITTFFACKKSETSDLITPYNKLKLFDDTLGIPTPYFERMAAGNNRLYMAYVHGDNFSIFSDETKTQVLVTDNEGQLIKHDSIPGGILINALVAHPDETFSVVAYDGTQQNNIVYLFHYNNNGNLISDDSLLLPADNYLYAACKSHAGNIFITSADGTTGGGYLLECDASGNILWRKDKLY